MNRGVLKIGMLLKGAYCHHCGTKLQKTLASFEGKKDSIAYNNYINKKHHSFISNYNAGDFIRGDYLSETRFGYKCDNCGSKISYESQMKIKKIQKESKTKVLSLEQVAHIPMAQKRDYTEAELFWAFVECSSEPSIIVKPKNIK